MPLWSPSSGLESRLGSTRRGGVQGNGPFRDDARVYRNSLLSQHEAHLAGVSRSDWFARTCDESAGSAERSLVQRDECSRHHEIARGLTRQNKLVASP